jgi:2-hydroxychromene-2-carboxylate isomerase
VQTIVYYFDLGSPYAYLSAERLQTVPGEDVVWRPILLGGLFAANGRGSWARAGDVSRSDGIAQVERRARAYGLPPVRWPAGWPSDYLFAMRAASFAFLTGVEIGKAFTMRAFRRAFQDGRDISRPEVVLDVASEVGLAREEAEAACGEPRVKLALREATEAAHRLGVFGVPTFAVGSEFLWGDDRLEEAARLAHIELPARARAPSPAGPYVGGAP